AGLGGRAASDVVDGFTLNQGPHAFYLGGAARTELAALGIDPPGRVPMPTDPRLVRADGSSRSVLRGVRYLHGGWQSLVDALTTRAWDRGADLRTGAAVRSLTRGDGGWVA